MPVENRVEYIKVYTVQIAPPEGVKNGFWYMSQKGRCYHAVLCVKETENNVFKPRFLLVDKVDGEYVRPLQIRTIRPEDCRVVEERNINPTLSLRSYINNYHKSHQAGGIKLVIN